MNQRPNIKQDKQTWAIWLIIVSIVGMVLAAAWSSVPNHSSAPSQKQVANFTSVSTPASTINSVPVSTATPKVPATSTPNVAPIASATAIPTNPPTATPTIAPTPTKVISEEDMDATINAAYYDSKMDQEATANAVEDAYFNSQMGQDATMAAIDAHLGIYQDRNETSCVIKGNISTTGEKIYHLPGQRFYAQTTIDISKGERWFCTEQEAIDAGWRKSKV